MESSRCQFIELMDTLGVVENVDATSPNFSKFANFISKLVVAR